MQVIGCILNCLFLGVTLSQSYSYYRNYRRTDRPLYLWTVGTLVVVDIFHSAITCYTVYDWCVINYSNPSILSVSPWSFTIEPMITGLVAMVVQLFYAWRVYAVSNHRLLIPITIITLSVVQCAWSIASTVRIVQLDAQFSQFATFEYGVIIWLTAAAAADCLISGSLMYYLSAHTGEHSLSSSAIEIIILRTIECNSLSTMAAIANIILFVTAAQTGTWHVAAQLVLVKLYINSLLVSLNSRKDVANALNQTSVSMELKSNANLGRSGSALQRNRFRDGEPRAMPVHVLTMTEESADYESSEDQHSGWKNGVTGLMAHERPLPSPDRRQAGEPSWV